jgi:hypothetical protein
MKEKKDKLIRAAWKKAVGYKSTESVEEIAEREGEMTVVKQKVTKKEVPPDVSAIKLLLECGEYGDLSDLSEEELRMEKKRLLRLLQEQESGKTIENDSEICIEKESQKELVLESD